MTRSTATLSVLSRTALTVVGALFVATGVLFIVRDVEIWAMPLSSLAWGSLFLFAGLRGRDPFDIDWFSARRPPSNELLTMLCILAVLGSPAVLVLLATNLSAPATVASAVVAALISFAPSTTTYGHPYLPITLSLFAGGLAHVFFGSAPSLIFPLFVGVSTGLLAATFVYAFAVAVHALRLRRQRRGAT